MKRYLAKTTGYSRAQLTRLIRRHRETVKVVDRRDGNQGRPIARVYTPADARLLAQVDADLSQMSGLATRVVLHREHHVFGDARFERLAGVSASHSYNLRGSRTYRTQRTVVAGTKATAVAGVRRAPQPDGMAGFLRGDTVHQGDRDGAKGMYVHGQRRGPDRYAVRGHAVRVRRRRRGDLRTFPGAAARRPARPVPVRRGRLPRRQRVAQRRAGSEYVNHKVAALLNKLHVRDFTKSRPRRSTDNALVEGKNASVVRRFLGHDHIPQRFRRWSTRSPGSTCRRTSTTTGSACSQPGKGANGRNRRVYRAAEVRTPYAKLRSLPDAEACLKPGISFAEVDAQANASSDLQAVRALNAARARLFRTIADAWLPGRLNRGISP